MKGLGLALLSIACAGGAAGKVDPWSACPGMGIRVVPCRPPSHDFRPFLPKDGKLDSACARWALLRRLYAYFKAEFGSPVVWNFDDLDEGWDGAEPRPLPPGTERIVFGQLRWNPNDRVRYRVVGGRIAIFLDHEVAGQDVLVEDLVPDQFSESFNDALTLSAADATSAAALAVSRGKCTADEGVVSPDEIACFLGEARYSPFTTYQVVEHWDCTTMAIHETHREVQYGFMCVPAAGSCDPEGASVERASPCFGGFVGTATGQVRCHWVPCTSR